MCITDNMQYSVDESIVRLLSTALDTQDRELIEICIENIQDRANGVCFCHAHSASECCCGAWDGIWDEQED